MSITSIKGILDCLLIAPIEYVVQISFCIMYSVFANIGIAIIAVSIVIQTLVLPLYKRADAIQEEERKKQEEMSYWVTHIKRTFKGEERFMMLSAYYREQNYKSWYSLRSSISLLLQIPFFIAAYRYLSNLPILEGESFLFISNLGEPDAIASVGGLTINILPILMTTINLISGIIYTRNTSVKDRIQVFGLAVIFLILLYDSPAGLVLYWTINQVYSVVKNLIMKFFAKEYKTDATQKECDNNAVIYRVYLVAAIFLSVFIGALIPINIIEASSAEFISQASTPITIVVNNFLLYAGWFIIWGSVFFWLASKKGRFVIVFFMMQIAVSGIADYMIWGNGFGVMSPLLVYEEQYEYSLKTKTINIVLFVLIAIIMYLFLLYFDSFVLYFFRILAISAIVFCVIMSFSIRTQINEYTDSRMAIAKKNEKILKLSKNGKNVVVFMLDRAVDGYIPYIFREKPELKSSFDGFIWYPNTLSHGLFTNFGVPGLYGGYEYTPFEMNKRITETLKDKHDEALLVLPTLFSENGYNVTVCDPPYAGYKESPDLSIYDGYDVDAYITNGVYNDNYASMFSDYFGNKQRESFFFYSLMRVCPVVLQNSIYCKGEYLSHFSINNDNTDYTFLDPYTTLLSLSDITLISDDNSNNFLQLCNNTTHEPVLLSVPEYSYNADKAPDVLELNEYYQDKKDMFDGLKLEGEYKISHYQVNVVALMALGKWFDYIRDNECWDNTRIIIVADHGREIAQFEDMMFSNDLDVQGFNPLLMVKDFDEKSFRESDEFMTNADVPSLALDKLIDDPVNPFTGKEINMNKKKNSQQVCYSYNWSIADNDGYTFDTEDGCWYEVKPGNMFDENNWSLSDYRGE